MMSYIYSTHICFPASERAVVTGVVPSPPPDLAHNFIAHRVQQSHCSSIFHRIFLTHALAFSTSQFWHKKKSPRIYTSMNSGEFGFEITKLTYTKLDDNLIRHRDGRHIQVEVRHDGQPRGLRTSQMLLQNTNNGAFHSLLVASHRSEVV